MLYFYGIMAEMERDFISTRTKAALAAAKARGVKLGGARPQAEARHKAVREEADARAKTIAPTISSMRESGSKLIVYLLSKIVLHTLCKF